MQPANSIKVWQISTVLEKILSWYTKSVFHYTEASLKLTSKSLLKHGLPFLIKISS